LTIATTEEVAVVRSESVARDPEERPAPVRVRVPAAQMSEAIATPLVRERVPFSQISATRVPKVVRERVVAFQTLVGILVAREEEAARTVALVLALTAEVMPEVAPVVPRAREVEAFATIEPIEVEAARTVESV
jgi:hypothetical protein